MAQYAVSLSGVVCMSCSRGQSPERWRTVLSKFSYGKGEQALNWYFLSSLARRYMEVPYLLWKSFNIAPVYFYFMTSYSVPHLNQ